MSKDKAKPKPPAPPVEVKPKAKAAEESLEVFRQGDYEVRAAVKFRVNIYKHGERLGHTDVWGLSPEEAANQVLEELNRTK